MLTRLFLTFGAIIICQISFSQISKSDLNGEWSTNNTGQLYYSSDTVDFVINPNFLVDEVVKGHCEFIQWSIQNSHFVTSRLHMCSEPPNSIMSLRKQKLKLQKTDFGQVISLFEGDSILDKFKLLNHSVNQIEDYPYEAKAMSVLRFDKLEDELIYQVVDSLITHYFEYRPESKPDKSVIISDSNPDVEITIRGHPYDYNPEPLLVLNGYPLESRDILKKFLLVETTSLNFLTKEKAASLYGERARNGVIIVVVSQKKFKKIWKQYGG